MTAPPGYEIRDIHRRCPKCWRLRIGPGCIPIGDDPTVDRLIACDDCGAERSAEQRARTGWPGGREPGQPDSPEPDANTPIAVGLGNRGRRVTRKGEPFGG